MPSTCLFELDHSNGVYYSGQTINGTIKLTTSSEKNVHNVRIAFKGEGKVKWDESYTTSTGNGNTVTNTICYRAHEVYVSNETVVHGEGKLPMGQHTYTFSIILPLQCPTSCEGRYGHIRYGISLILNRVLRFDNVYHRPLTVLKTVDLNLNPVFKLPLLAEDNASVCCWPCSGGKMIYSLRVPFGAYSPGQLVKYALAIQNQTMANTNGYLLEFIQRKTFTVTSPQRKQRQTKNTLVKRTYSETCLRLTNRIFEGEFRIPSISPTTDPSSIIHVDYKLKLTIYMMGCHKSRDISVPIFIGTIPLRESLVAAVEVVTPTAPEPEILKENPETATSDMPPSYLDLKPPSYEATVECDSHFVDHDVDKHHRVDDFKPLYPMYS
ncbi:arrestin domain-containing protein 3-like [Haematobia irritans]|uniref:arrestin domain-containing protein 3-like n=1 Tax=Haematobia irritans TaxID=7368 RepID=UPI003F507725